MTETPAISVLVPAWNAERSIARAIASVLDHGGDDLECIVVDDASTDRTLEIVRAIAATDPRVVVIALEANGGVSNARNRGLALVRGEWLTLLDADDRFRPGGISALHRAAVGRDALAVIGQQVWSDGRRSWIGPLYDIPDIRTPGRKSLASAPGLLYYVSPHGKLFHRSLVEGLRFEGRVLGDQPWVIRALLRAGDRIEVLGETVYDWIRVAPPGSGPSITAATRSSATRGVEAAEVAGHAFAAVLAEIELEVPDGSEASRLARTYLERLLRSDLGVHLSRALDRSDPAMADLFSAISGFLAPLPANLWPGRAVLHEIIEPPLRRWSQVPEAARPAFDALVADVLARQRRLAESGRNPIDRWALQRLLPRSGRRSDPAAFAALGLTSLARAAVTAPRRADRGVRRVLRRGRG